MNLGVSLGEKEEERIEFARKRERTHRRVAVLAADGSVVFGDLVGGYRSRADTLGRYKIDEKEKDCQRVLAQKRDEQET